MRLLLTTFALLMLLGNPAMAGSAYDEVPLGHWSYEVLDWIVNESEINDRLEYPTEFFTKERPLTRIEFAQAACKLQDSLSWEEPDEIRLLADMLSIEFFHQVSELNSPLTCALGVEDYDYSFNPPNWKAYLDRKLRWEYGEAYPVIDSDSNSAYADVPTTHWAYDAIRHFIDIGYLEGYPDHFFCRDRILTRYEFALAIARVLDTMQDVEDLDPYDKQIGEILRSEFSDQLAALSSQLETLDQQIRDMGATLCDLEASVSN